jgi:cell division septation protein DedD
VSQERDEKIAEQEYDELYDDAPPRSIFAATWFRVILIVIVLGVVGAVVVPYALDWLNPPSRSATAPKPPLAVAATPATPPVADKPSDGAALEKSPAAKPDAPPAGRRDSTVLPAPAASPIAAAPAQPETKPPTATKSAAKAALAGAESAARPQQARLAAKAPTSASGGAAYWVQVGAFKDAEAARRLAGKLRDENFKVEESLTRASAAPADVAKTPASETGTEQYAVFVAGASVEDVNRRLSGKGLTAEAAPGGGVVVKPPLALRDAVTLSKDLAVEGLKVQVRRAGAVTAAATAPNGGPALHRVRVGAFGDKSAALAAARELETKGYKPYIARGDQ